MKDSKGIILTTYHKQFPVLKESFILPLHVGRASSDITKDGSLSTDEKAWMVKTMAGDDTGYNISDRNREFSECTGLYWFWKNFQYSNLEYVGVFQYRRQLILNDLFERSEADREKRIYKCVHLDKNEDICGLAGISEAKILEILNRYDYILPYPTELQHLNIRSAYEDYVKLIPGVHITDLFILEELYQKLYPGTADKLKEYLSSPNKLMYQVFITKPALFTQYCEWLFDILFRLDLLVDSSLYSTNGRRTMGYLAEILYGFYFTKLIPQEKTFRTGVTYLE